MSNWPFPRVLAHRGAGTLAPENTLAAMRCGLQHGFRAAEFDVMLAHDGVPVVIHDTCLGRTVAGNADIAALTSSELTAMDAGSWHGADFSGELVPTFEQVFAFCRANDIWMNIEIKPTLGAERDTGRIVAMLAQQWSGPTDLLPPLLSSFSLDAMLAAQAAAPTVPRALLMDLVADDWRERLNQITAVALHTNQKYLTRTVVDAVRSKGFGLFCYTVNDPARAVQLFEWGVDAMCTDRLDLISPHLGDTYFS